MSRTISDVAICRVISKALPPQIAIDMPSPEMSLRNHLGIDSFGLISMVFMLEAELGVELVSFADRFAMAESVADIIGIVRGGLDP